MFNNLRRNQEGSFSNSQYRKNMSEFEKKLDKALIRFADWIRPPKTVKDNGDRLGNELLRIFQRHPLAKIRPDRLRFGGGYEKDTSTILKLDIDLVFFVNCAPTKDVLVQWKSQLIRETSLEDKDFNVGLALSFVYKGFDVDVCVAQNLSHDVDVQVSIIYSFNENNVLQRHCKHLLQTP